MIKMKMQGIFSALLWSKKEDTYVITKKRGVGKLLLYATTR